MDKPEKTASKTAKAAWRANTEDEHSSNSGNNRKRRQNWMEFRSMHNKSMNTPKREAQKNRAGDWADFRTKFGTVRANANSGNDRNRKQNWIEFRSKHRNGSELAENSEIRELHENRVRNSTDFQGKFEVASEDLDDIPQPTPDGDIQPATPEEVQENTDQLSHQTAEDGTNDDLLNNGLSQAVVEGYFTGVERPALTLTAAQQQEHYLVPESMVRPDPQNPSNKSRNFKRTVLPIGMCCMPLCLLVGVAIFVLVRYWLNLSSTEEHGTFPTSSPTKSTSPPTFAPTSSKFVAIKNVVENKMDIIISIDIQSPQLQAIRWLADEDDFQLDLTDVSSVLERYALATFYFSTGGEDSWGNGGCNFMSNEHICSWNNISQYYSDKYRDISLCGVLCASSPRFVTHLRIDPHMLNGTLPEAIGLLSKLIFMEIEYNRGLVGSLPSWLGDLSQLVQLRLSLNALTGIIPSTLSQLQNLRDLNLVGNKLTGTIPSTLGQLQNLGRLTLRGNEFTGTVPSIFGNLANMRLLSLEANFLTGTLPLKRGEMPALQELYMGFNLFEGIIPEAVFSYSMLRRLHLGGNNFIASIPSSIGNLANLAILNLGWNNFVGSIPSSIKTLNNLRILSLMHNMLTGTIPSELGEVRMLRDIDLSSNLLTGEIPESLGNLTMLEKLELESNRINGTVPLSLLNLESLWVLYLYETDLKGNISFMAELPFKLAIADCRGDDPEVICSFCTHCCEDNEGCFVHGSNIPFFL